MINYKSIIRNEKLRYKILMLMDGLPDKYMVSFQYFLKTGRWPNLINPSRYTEKLQWMKVNYRNELMKKCADKYSVRDYVTSKGLGSILNELYGVYESPEDINWNELPKEFVLKDTLGGGGRSMIFVKDKDLIDKKEAMSIMKEWVSTPIDKKSLGREWVYDGKRHRIIAEKLLINPCNDDLPDYKFFCFNGKVKCLYMMENYTMHHEQGVLGFLDRSFRLLSACRADFKPMKLQPQMPMNYIKMRDMAEKLSEGFPHVRVDFYNLNGEIVFGEMTFFNASGYSLFKPDEFDYELGKEFILPEKSGGVKLLLLSDNYINSYLLVGGVS